MRGFGPFLCALAASSILTIPNAARAAEAVDPAIVALAPVPTGQLTQAARPLAYRIDTRFDPSAAGFSGRTEIDIELAAPSTFIDLHGRNLAIASVVARPTDGGQARWNGTWHEVDDSGVARIVFPQQLPAGKITLEFTYTGQYQDGPSGLFRTAIDGKSYGWSQFQSIDARAAFPGFDDPGFKVPFTLTIRTRPGEVAVSNAPEVSSKVEDGWQVHRFAPTLPLPTYLVAMMSGPFVVAESAVPPTPQRAQPLPLRIVTTQNNADKTAFALEQSKPIVALLENYFGQAFPYPKLDQISSPLMGGAMENAGADLYADTILMLPDNAPIWQQKLFGMVVAHELAHQWFGDLVTPVWWDDIWLNESFANWMGYTIGGQWRPDLKIDEGKLAEGFRAMSTDTLVVGRPIHESIPTNDRIDGAFDTITYGKGGHVVSMIGGYLGEETFRDGVRKYMAAHTYGNATSKDFFAAMASAAGDPRITSAMQSFTDQQGVPLVTITGTDGRYSATQGRYFPMGVTAPQQAWGVPVCMRVAAERECALVGDGATEFSFATSGPLVPNVAGNGYYRFDMPKAEWDRLIAVADTLGAGEAMAANDSLEASFHAGRATADQMIALMRKLLANPDPYASGSADGFIDGARRAGMLDEAAQKAWRAFQGREARAALGDAGFDVTAGAYADADADKRQTIARLVGNLVFARDAAALAKLAAAAEGFISGDANALDRSFLNPAFDAFVIEGGMTAVKRLADFGLANEDSVLRGAALDAIAQAGTVEAAEFALSGFGGDSRLRTSEKLGALLTVLQSTKTRDLGYAALMRDIGSIEKGSGGIFMIRAIPSAVRGFCSFDRADTIAKDLTPILAGTAGALELQRSLERIRNCAAIKDARGAEISEAVAVL